MRKMHPKKVEMDPLVFKKPQQQKPTVKQTLVWAIITSILSISLIVVGMGLKLNYGNSLYFPDERYWLAVMALVFIAVGVPIGVTAACLINTLCRVREYVSYKEAKRRELESRVADYYIPDKPAEE
ncbi:Histone H2A [Fasciolopsis buskii]|uniref:Histone H2A n=1 Tax=Fasciolopsis buskii TaxID=27845 RepID=A0A8E0RK57_9TREM|nr:Histone H2A [Fasciolopsis buski]